MVRDLLMTAIAKEIVPINIEDEMKQSYLDYAMSVIVGRALPDVRDGLKPVHRRVLFAMSELGNDWNKPYKKSARVVGDVIGKYHPHGDSAVYDTIVRMAQPFSLRYMLIDGQGNFGSIDGDAPAAMRYTEVRMARLAREMLADIEKETVDFIPNYDDSSTEPTIFPSRLPNLIVNGSSGIAVGMATNIPPHNLSEVIDACIALIDNPELTIKELMYYLPGPDFPTAGIINGTRGIQDAYETGRGRIQIRARAEIENDTKHNRQAIIVTELPYQVNKARLIEKIAELVKEKKIDGISELRDESDKDGLRIYIALKRNENADVVLNNLFIRTTLQCVFGINIVALVNGQPQLLNLKQVLIAFIEHRREIVMRRTIFELRQAREKSHVIEGLLVVLSNLELLIDNIRRAADINTAKNILLQINWLPGKILELGSFSNQTYYQLSAKQIQSILDLKLHRLTNLEQDKLIREYEFLSNKIVELSTILNKTEKLTAVIRAELEELRDQYADARRTVIQYDAHNFEESDLVTEETVVVTLSHAGYIKSQPLSLYRAQRRGGRGRTATLVKDEDFAEKLFIASTHDTLLCFSNRGKVYWKKVHELPYASRTARGRPIINLLPLSDGERINAVLTVRTFTDDQYIFFATSNGTVKKTPLSAYSHPRPSGIRAIELRSDDQLVSVELTNGKMDIMLFSDVGKVMRFSETEVRDVGRSARGVFGINVRTNEKVIALIVIGSSGGAILTVTENGYGKRTPITDYPKRGRGGKGIISIKTSERNGRVIGAVQVVDDQEIMLLTDGGTLVRTPVDGISLMGRNTQGVKLISLHGTEKLISLDKIMVIGNE